MSAPESTTVAELTSFDVIEMADFYVDSQTEHSFAKWGGYLDKTPGAIFNAHSGYEAASTPVLALLATRGPLSAQDRLRFAGVVQGLPSDRDAASLARNLSWLLAYRLRTGGFLVLDVEPSVDQESRDSRALAALAAFNSSSLVNWPARRHGIPAFVRSIGDGGPKWVGSYLGAKPNDAYLLWKSGPLKASTDGADLPTETGWVFSGTTDQLLNVLAPQLSLDPNEREQPSKVTGKFPLPAGHWFGLDGGGEGAHPGDDATDRRNIKLIQVELGVKADGIYGPDTFAACVAWQLATADANSAADGRVTSTVWSSLR